MPSKAKSGSKKTAAKKPAAKKAASKKVAAKKATAKKPAAKKTAAKKAVAKKTAAKKPAAKKAVAKKPAVKKAVAKKPAVKKAAVKKSAVKKAVVKKVAEKIPPAKKPAVKKAAAKKTAVKAKAVAKPAEPSLPKLPLHKGVAVARITNKDELDNKEPRPAQQRKDSLTALMGPAQPSKVLVEGSGFMGIPAYQPAPGEEYMGEAQREHFKKILLVWKKALMEEVDRTVNHMQDEAANFPDPNDRATQEEEFSLELRTRDRERKLIKKIEEAMITLEEDEYGYCEMCGIEIGIRRLEARPTATLCIDCKTMDEIRERQGN